MKTAPKNVFLLAACGIAAVLLAPTGRAQETVDDSTIETPDTNIDSLEPTSREAFFSDASSGQSNELDNRFIVHPITSPNYHDDAYITTDVRGTYINHQFPRNAFADGGAARVYDLQGRFAVSDNLQVMVSKLGIADVHFGGSEEYGGTDVAVAVKYAPLQDWQNQEHLAVGVGYELGVGDRRTFGSDDELRIFAAYSAGFERANVGLNANAIFSTDREGVNGESDRASVHAHFDYAVNSFFSPVAELNYYTVFDESAAPTAVSGLDFGAFGGNASEDVLSLGLGGEYRPLDGLAVRLAYESPLTDNDDLFGYRWTLSAIWRF